MSDNKQDDGKESEKPDLGIVDDLARLGTTLGQIFRYWTIPMNAAPIDSLESTERETFRIASLAIIVFLFLILRPDIQNQVASIIFGIVLASAIALLSNALLVYNVKVSDRIIIGSYSYLACTLAIYILFRGFFPDSILEIEQFSADETFCTFFEGGTDPSGTCETSLAIQSAAFTLLFSIPVLIAKSLTLDGNELTAKSIFKGFLAVFSFILVCLILDLMPTGLFDFLADKATN